jgi:hypothetical protein
VFAPVESLDTAYKLQAPPDHGYSVLGRAEAYSTLTNVIGRRLQIDDSAVDSLRVNCCRPMLLAASLYPPFVADNHPQSPVSQFYRLLDE